MPDRFKVLGNSGFAISGLGFALLFFNEPRWVPLLGFLVIGAGMFWYGFIDKWEKENSFQLELLKEALLSLDEKKKELEISKVIVTGILGADPETRKTSDGSRVANIKLGIKNYEIDEVTGENKELTEWYRVVFFDAHARIVTDILKLKKGELVRVEGNLVGRNWRDKDGHDRFAVEVQATATKKLSVAQLVDASS